MLFALGAIGFAVALVAAPIGPVWLAVPMYAAGAIICHQIPERSFHIGAIQLPVCARCLGIYAGAAAVALWLWLAPSTSRRVTSALARRRMLVAAVLPTVVTVLGEWSGVWHTSNVVRALAGTPLGGALGVLMAAAAATLHYDRCARRPPVQSMPPRHI